MNSSKQVILISYLFTSLNAMEANDGQTELHKAALHGDILKVFELLNKNADPNSQTKLGKTPAHKSIYAEQKQCVEILRLLKQAGADLNIQDIEGSTALHLAVRNQKKEVIIELECLGCKKEIIDKNGHTSDDLKIIVMNRDLAKQYLQNPKDLTQEYLTQFKKNKKRVTFFNSQNPL